MNQYNNDNFNNVQQSGNLNHQNNVMFKADQETREILNSVYPELISAMINISIKKFSKSQEFKNYYLIVNNRGNANYDESIDEDLSNNTNVTQQSHQSPQPQQQTSSVSPVADFSSW